MSGRPVGSAGWHAIVTLAGQWGKYVVQIVALVVFSRLLSPSEFGVVAMVTAVAGIASLIGDLGLSMAAIQAPRLTDGQRSNLFWLTTAMGVLVGAGVAACGPVLADLYDNDRVRPVAQALAAVFVFNGVAGQFRTELTRQARFGRIATGDVTGQVVGVGAGLVVILAGGGLWGLVAQQVVAALVSMLWVMTRIGWWPTGPRRGQQMRALFSFGSYTLGGSIINYISINIDQILIGRWWGASIVGLYNRAFMVARLPAQQVAVPLTRVVVPHLVRRLDDPVAFSRAMRRAQTMVAGPLILLFAYLIAVAPDVVRFGLGSGWQESVGFVRVLCLAGLVESASRVYFWAALAHGRPGLVFRAELGGRVVMVGLMLAGVSHGAIWVAWAGVAGQLILGMTNVLYVVPKVGLDPWPMVAVALGLASVVTPATLVVMALGHYLDSWPAVVALAALSVLWLLLCLPALALARIRSQVREAVTYARRNVRSAG